MIMTPLPFQNSCERQPAQSGKLTVAWCDTETRAGPPVNSPIVHA
jgi:hypothetical protein